VHIYYVYSRTNTFSTNGPLNKSYYFTDHFECEKVLTFDIPGILTLNQN